MITVRDVTCSRDLVTWYWKWTVRPTVEKLFLQAGTSFVSVYAVVSSEQKHCQDKRNEYINLFKPQVSLQLRLNIKWFVNDDNRTFQKLKEL